MSTAKIFRTESSKSGDTLSLGEKLGKNLRGGEVIVLKSDLGGGKTTLAKGIASGLGCNENISSPTFTVGKVYKGRDGLEMHHFDFYRLHDPGVVGYELAEVIDEPKAVIVIEWGDIVKDVLPERSIVITLKRVVSGEDMRSIKIKYPRLKKYVLEGIV